MITRRAIVLGGNVLTRSGPKFRRCPKCDAAPGHSCGRWTSREGGYWVTMKGFHTERRERRPWLAMPAAKLTYVFGRSEP